MKTLTIKTFNFAELSQEAKEKALENFRNINVDDGSGWYDFIFEEIQEGLAKIGFENIDISFSGFWYQGDGASFTCKSVNLEKFINSTKERKEKYKALAPYIEDGTLTASIYRTSHLYSHENTCSVLVETQGMLHDDVVKNDDLIAELENELERVRYEASKEIYKTLKKEYNYLISDDAVIETIEANEYDFLPSGERRFYV